VRACVCACVCVRVRGLRGGGGPGGVGRRRSNRGVSELQHYFLSHLPPPTNYSWLIIHRDYFTRELIPRAPCCCNFTVFFCFTGRSFDVAANPPLRVGSVSRMFFFFFFLISLKLWTELRERIVSDAHIGYAYSMYYINVSIKLTVRENTNIRNSWDISLSKRYLRDPIISLSRIITLESVFSRQSIL